MAVSTRPPAGHAVAALFSVALFVNSALLILVQPMVARMVLPLLGGTPSVWNACMMFFQALLLAGYAWAHAGAALLGARRQAMLHVLLLLVPIAMLPIALPAGWSQPGDVPPAAWLLGLLTLAVGLPFFVLSTAAPMLQGWLAATDHPAGRDPYFLYAASNAGSMLALLAYPFWIERVLPLSRQQLVWSAGYGVAAALTIACAAVLWMSPRREWRRPAAEPHPDQHDRPLEATPPDLRRRARWVLLAFVPSSLLLSVTLYLTTDLGAIPMLWVAPLALYLLSFTLVFARRRPPQRVLSRGLPLVVLLLVLVLLSEATEPFAVLVVLHLCGLLWIGMFCHGALAEDRPGTGHLTEFYLWIAVGGVLGGLFNALVAPVIFSSVVEYPLVLVVAALARGTGQEGRGTGTLRAAARAGRHGRARDVLWALGLGLLTAALVLGFQAAGLEPGPLSIAAMFAAPAVLCYTFLGRPLRFGLGLASLLLAGALYDGVHGQSEARMRSFFGVHRVTVDPTGSFRVLVHGNTVHGRQSLDPARRREPLAYYHRTAPIGEVFRAMEGDPRLQRVGVVGLGAGALAAWAGPGQQWTFFEIDPAVIRLARDSGYFTYLADARAPVAIVRGDARMTLAAHRGTFGLLILDAFSSDAIPLHLLTREALEVYRARLAPGGLLAVHVSNRYLDLQPVLAALAEQAVPPMAGIVRDDFFVTPEEEGEGKAPSIWVVLAESREALGPLASSPRWKRLAAPPGAPLWSDERSNLLEAMGTSSSADVSIYE